MNPDDGPLLTARAGREPLVLATAWLLQELQSQMQILMKRVVLEQLRTPLLISERVQKDECIFTVRYLRLYAFRPDLTA